MFNKTFTRQIESEIQAAINEVTARHGISKVVVDFRRARDGSFGRLMKIDFYPSNSEDTSGLTPAGLPNVSQTTKSFVNQLSTLNGALEFYGLKSSNAKGDRLIEYNPSKPKNKFMFVSAGGTRWNCDLAHAKKRFGLNSR